MRMILIGLITLMLPCMISVNEFILISSVTVQNTGNTPVNNIVIKIPEYKSESSYSSIQLLTNSKHEIAYLLPGETKVVENIYEVKLTHIDYQYNLMPEYVIAKSIFNGMDKSGNCRDVTLAYIELLKPVGIETREVVGFVRPKRGDMTAGDLKGNRHSWAEIKINDEWLPVDIKFNYFGELPYKSHIVEGYTDKSVVIEYNNGQIDVRWDNLLEKSRSY